MGFLGLLCSPVPPRHLYQELSLVYNLIRSTALSAIFPSPHTYKKRLLYTPKIGVKCPLVITCRCLALLSVEKRSSVASELIDKLETIGVLDAPEPRISKLLRWSLPEKGLSLIAQLLVVVGVCAIGFIKCN